MKYLPHNAVCAELGVYKGKFAKQILRHLSPKKLYLIDPYWKSYGDTFSWNDVSTEDALSEAIRRIRQYDTNNIAVIVVDYDYNFLGDLPDNFFDWVYLDTTHKYEDTLRELDLIARKIKDDGLIAGHDWHEEPKNKHYGVYKAMKKWLKLNPEYYFCYKDDRSQWILKKTIE